MVGLNITSIILFGLAFILLLLAIVFLIVGIIVGVISSKKAKDRAFEQIAREKDFEGKGTLSAKEISNVNTSDSNKVLESGAKDNVEKTFHVNEDEKTEIIFGDSEKTEIIFEGYDIRSYVSLISKDEEGEKKEYRKKIKDAIVIGRTKGDIIIDTDKSISSTHCKIEKRENEYFITDLGSSNGTFVNGNKLEKEEPIKNGDVIKLGRKEFSVEIGEE